MKSTQKGPFVYLVLVTQQNEIMKRLFCVISCIAIISCQGLIPDQGYPFVTLTVHIYNDKECYAFLQFNSRRFNNHYEYHEYYSYLGNIRPQMYEEMPIGGQSYPDLGIDSVIHHCRTLGEFYDFIGTDTFFIIIFPAEDLGYQWIVDRNDSSILYKKMFREKDTGRKGKYFEFSDSGK